MVRRGVSLTELLLAVTVTATVMATGVSVFVAVHKRMLRTAAEASLLSQLNMLADDLERMIGSSAMSTVFSHNGRPALVPWQPSGTDGDGDGVVEQIIAPIVAPDMQERFTATISTVLYFSDSTGSLGAGGPFLFRSIGNSGPNLHWSREGSKPRWHHVEFVEYSAPTHQAQAVRFTLYGSVRIRNDQPEFPGTDPTTVLGSGQPMEPSRDVIRMSVSRTVYLRNSRILVAP